jgi:hypothetical protein
VNSHIDVDGELDEPFWEKALVLPIQYENQPGENIPAPVATDVLLAYDDRQLFVAFRADDPNPSAIRAHVTDRDAIWSEDHVAIILDTFNDERRNYFLASNALGCQCDMIETQDSQDDSWDAIWDSAGRITDQGYCVEMAIPFSSLRFQRSAEDQIWGIDARRQYPRDVTHSLGLFPVDRGNNCYLCQAEKVVGFAGATPGRNVELDPTFSALVPQVRRDGTAGPFMTENDQYEPGMTARWGMTPNLTLNGTLNPDFSQVEADAAQLDINTQFALYYPEKRPFFLEGSDFFRTPFRVLNTRTMADPAWGMKLTGKEAGNTIGAYVVRDDVTNLIFPGNQGSRSTHLPIETTASALRYRRDFGSRSTVGILATDREGEDYYNRALSLDADFRLTRKDRVQIQAIGSSTRYPEHLVPDFSQPRGRFNGGGLDFAYFRNTRTWGWHINYTEMGHWLRTDLGFIPRVGYRHYFLETDYTWNPQADSWWSRLNLQGSVEQMEDQDGSLLDRTGALRFTFEGPLQSHAILEARRIREAYNGQEFDQNYFFIHNCMNPNGDIHTWLNITADDHIDYAHTRLGKRIQIGPGFSYRVGLHGYVDVGHTFERMTVNGGRLYTANVSQGTFIYHFNRRTFLRTILQYVNYDHNTSAYADPIDSREEHLFSQILFSYKINPQTVLFLGYSDNYRGDQQMDLTQIDRTFFAKVGYAWVL